MSAFPNSGRSDHGNSQISRGRFRPEADVWFVHPIMVYTKLARCKRAPRSSLELRPASLFQIAPLRKLSTVVSGCRDFYDSDVVKGRLCRIKFPILPNRYEFRVTDGVGPGGPFNIDGVFNRCFASPGGMILACRPSPGPAQALDLCRPVGDSFECDFLS